MQNESSHTNQAKEVHSIARIVEIQYHRQIKRIKELDAITILNQLAITESLLLTITTSNEQRVTSIAHHDQVRDIYKYGTFL